MFRNFIITISLFFTILNADILDIHKKIVPISLLQVSSIVNKQNKIISLIIIVNKNEELKALRFKRLLPKTIKKYKFKVNIIYENELLNGYKNYLLEDCDAIYSFHIQKNSSKQLSKFAIKNRKITFAYKKNGLDCGLLLYIEFTNKISIYINKHILKQSKIVFNSRFLRMVKSYD